MIDLVGIDLKARRAKMKVTLLRRLKGTWSQADVSRLVNGIRNSVSGHPQHPEVLLLPGDVPKEQLVTIVGQDNFDHQVIEGMDNPSLPFKPQFI